MTMPDISWVSALVNHLWQSTAVAGIATLLVLALSRNHARVRYWLWMAASVKFLMPFSLLIAAGAWLRSFLPAPAVRPAVIKAMEQVTLPLQQPEFSSLAQSPAATHPSSWLPILLLAIWACGALFVAVRFARGWWSVRAARQAARPLALAADVPVLASQSTIEPGIFGFFRPVLLLPEGILERLSAEQLSAIVAHEMCHVRRRDNMTYSAHMLTEALFWFYPPVWWIGKRLIEERERACDEAVVDASGNPHIYAEGILNVCKFCVESPLECVSGVTGSDLKKRITRIMHHHVALRMTLGRKILLASAGCIALAAPLVVGLVCMGQGQAQSGDDGGPPIHFAVAAIHPDPPDDKYATGRAAPAHDGIVFLPDGISMDGLPIELFIKQTFGVEADQITGLPAWAKTVKYSIQAKVDDADAPRWKALSREQTSPRTAALQGLLADRFNFKAHVEMQPHSVYCLVVAKNGPKFHASAPADGTSQHHEANFGNGKITMQGSQIATLIFALSHQGLGHPVVDQTGLAGEYDLTLHFEPSNTPGADSTDPPLFTALQEQLGLKLEWKKAPLETIVVDHIDLPSPN
jgi:bla regulator protein BlaR1